MFALLSLSLSSQVVKEHAISTGSAHILMNLMDSYQVAILLPQDAAVNAAASSAAIATASAGAASAASNC